MPGLTSEQWRERIAAKRAELDGMEGLVKADVLAERREELDAEERTLEQSIANWEAEAARREADEARRRVAAIEETEAHWAREKASRRAVYVLNGGDGATFDANWPAERDRLVRERMNSGHERAVRPRL